MEIVIGGVNDHTQTDERSFREVYYGRFVGPATWYRVIGPFLVAALDTGYWASSILRSWRGWKACWQHTGAR